MPVRNDDANQSALHPSAHEEEQDAQIKDLRERLTRLESLLQKHLTEGQTSQADVGYFYDDLSFKAAGAHPLPSSQRITILCDREGHIIEARFAEGDAVEGEFKEPDFVEGEGKEAPQRQRALTKIFHVYREGHLPTPAAQQREIAEGRRRLLHQLDEWLADDSGYDEETWPKLKAELEQDRLSSRSLFDE